jgi:hypothetical protein
MLRLRKPPDLLIVAVYIRLTKDGFVVTNAYWQWC